LTDRPIEFVKALQAPKLAEKQTKKKPIVCAWARGERQFNVAENIQRQKGDKGAKEDSD